MTEVPIVTIGFDPGKHGGIAMLENGRIAWATTMPLSDDTPSGIDWAWIGDTLFELVHAARHPVACIEHVSAMPRDGRVSAFSFGGRLEGIVAVCECLHLDYILARPAVWKRAILGKGKHDKADSIEAARAIPGLEEHLIPERCRKPHDGIAEAALIALYGALRIAQMAQDEE